MADRNIFPQNVVLMQSSIIQEKFLMKNKFKVVDLFCGGGGLSQGLANAGFEIVAAFDNWDAAINFYSKNIPDHPIEKLDLLDSKAVSAYLCKYDFNMIVGGPPCQDFSSAGKRNENGGRANLTLSFAETIEPLSKLTFNCIFSLKRFSSLFLSLMDNKPYI